VADDLSRSTGKQKPDNIGFDLDGHLKIFDFGLAKELREFERTKDGLYKLTGMTGAIRYMAPEVGLGKPYNLTADVYSWSMIMWFILALEPPFGFYTEDMIRDRVLKRGSRPAIFNSWSETLGNLMKRAWSVDITARPSFSEVCSVLNMEMVEKDGTIRTSTTQSGGPLE
jgi:serine/threonine protein kinase